MATDISFVPYETGTSAPGAQRIAVIDPRLRRTNYFDGQLLKASDLTRDQIYLDERLLELGQAFGSGIVRGLGVGRPQGQVLRVAPGIAVAPSGRVLELAGTALDIDLADAARLATLNDGRVNRLPRGLYILALARAEVIDDVAEAYPRDLAAPRVPRVSAYAEGVQLVLYRLPVGLPRQDEIAIRAALARELLGGQERFALPDDESVPLALLAVDGGRLQWLDQGLVRRPRRAPGTPGALQQDLATHYAELMQAVRAARSAAGLPDAFEAAQYFRVLPPHGPCPKAAIDPEGGRQSFFPEAWEVSIAPVRRSDLAALRADAERLAPIDMARDVDIDVMVLVPLPDAAHAVRARQLEMPPEAAAADRSGLLARRDRLALRVTPLAPVHQQATDASVWAAIWAEAAPDELLYVRRPPRAAETGVSAIVLAAGSRLPELAAALPPDTATLEAELDATAERAQAAERAAATDRRAREQAQAQVRQLEATVAEQRAALAQTGDERLADALEQVALLQDDLERAKAELLEMERSAVSADVIATALSATTAEIDRLRKDLEAARALVNRLETQLAGSGNSEGLRRELEALSARLKEQQAEREKLETRLKDADTSRALAEQQAKALQASVAELKETVEKLRSQSGGDGDALKQAEARIAGLQAELDKANDTLASRGTQLANLAEQLKSLRTEYDLAKAHIATLEAGTALGANLDKELDFALLASLRGVTDKERVAQLDKQLQGEPAARLAAVRLLVASNPEHDELLLASLAQVAGKVSALVKLEASAQELMRKQKASLARVMAQIGTKQGLDEALVKQWQEVAG